MYPDTKIKQKHIPNPFWHKVRVEEHNKMVKEDNIQPDSWAYAPPSINDEPDYY